jgi:hypothetical protein
MADYIPFISGNEGATLARGLFPDAPLVRRCLDRTDPSRVHVSSPNTVLWMDPVVDGMDDVETRKNNSWFAFMSTFPHFESLCDPRAHEKPSVPNVNAFVSAVLDKCNEQSPAWITVPQLPFTDASERNKINRALAAATGRWKSQSGFSGRFILPLVIMNQVQVNGKTARNPKIDQAVRCYTDASADGFWIVDKSLSDDNGSPTLRSKRFPGVIGFHEEINAQISSRIRIAGPYWGLNLVLWARGLVDHPAIGIGSGYQHFLSGGHARTPSVKLAIPSLRRRAGIAQLKKWLDSAIPRLDKAHAAYAELTEIRSNITILTSHDNARRQVATFYKSWYDEIAAAPAAGRSAALFADLTTAYALGKSLPDFPDEQTARRPESVAESLMLNCL